MSNSLLIRFAGEGGSGVVNVGTEIISGAVAQVGYHVLTYATFPSQIKGGPVWSQVRIATEPVLTPGDEVDVLVALDRFAYDHHIEFLREGGIVIYNSEEFELEPGERTIGIEADRLARESGNPRAANFIVMGAVAELTDLPLDYLKQFNRERFSRGREGDDQIIAGNNTALDMGAEQARASGLKVDSLDAPPKVEEERILIRGFEAACLGAIAGGLETFIGYPISPATTMLVFMEDNLVGEDVFVGQSSSEIESIASLIGAGFAGKKNMTSTAGPGLSLMGEGLGLAWMAEIPLVVVDVQRGGPATGLPTKIEQSDLLVALNPGHGDLRLPVIAPGTVQEAFYASMHALNWAERYQGPVIMLSDHGIADYRTDILRPDPSLVPVERREIADGATGNNRYGGDGRTPFPVPGGPGAYVANGSEHDEQGDTTHLPEVHQAMTERRFKKLELLNDGTYEAERTSAAVAVMPWGGSKGPARAAYNELVEQGEDIGWYYTMFLHPLPPGMLDELREKELVIVPELNYLGQFSSVLRSLGVRAESITQYTGLPFKESFLEEQIRQRTEAVVGKLAHA